MERIYNASAGTGKTYQVTALYEELVLEKGISPSRILLTTFTENAATELRMRVHQRIQKALEEAEKSEDFLRAEQARSALSALPSAQISTIHSYCASLLREHALEAGISPRFSVLDQEEADELLAQICHETLIELLKIDPAFQTFCAGITLTKNKKGFGNSLSETVSTLISIAGSFGISLERAETMLPSPKITIQRIDFEQILSRIDQLPKRTPTVKKAEAIIQQALDETSTLEELISRLKELGVTRFARGGKDAKEISDAFFELKTKAEESISYLKNYPATEAFARYIQTVASRFREEKHRKDTMDFNDQIQLALQLLKSGKASPEFEYLIVDEVQDTSRIQYELVLLLQKNGAQLIVCGDRKQSIYSWRGADPKVMPDLAALIHQRGGEQKNLQISYRTKSPILQVVNTLFSVIYGATQYDQEALLPNPDWNPQEKTSCVEFLEFDGDDEWENHQKSLSEMKAIAQRIQLLVGENPEWKPQYRFREDGFEPISAKNAYRYADILILLQKTTHQSLLEQALRQAHIPYVLSGRGKGLFSRQETQDVGLFLQTLNDPKNALAVIGFLRSPWVGISDEKIAELAWDGTHFSADHLLKTYESVCDIPRRYREQMARWLPSELLRMLIEETGYDALLSGLPRGAQRLANLQKVLDWLRENERGARKTPAQTIRKFLQHIEQPPPVPEAPLPDPHRNAVSVMTVHGSKGLTQRVVIIPETTSTPKSDSSWAHLFISPEKAPTIQIKATHPNKESTPSPEFKEAKDFLKETRSTESKNLFYVAMTRARDLVVFSGIPPKRKSGNSAWFSHLKDLLGKEIKSIPYSMLSEACKKTDPPPRIIPSVPQLVSALDKLPSPPPPPRLQRIAATQRAEQLLEKKNYSSLSTSSKSAFSEELGSLGHAVLEQLALHQWQGSVSHWIETLRPHFGIQKNLATRLESPIEHTRLWMQKQTNDQTLHPEFSFLLHQKDLLIDGTIDLLAHSESSFCLFDYKFTEQPDGTLIELYRPQLEIYLQAARHAFPKHQQEKVGLIAISLNGSRFIPISIRGNAEKETP